MGFSVEPEGIRTDGRAIEATAAAAAADLRPARDEVAGGWSSGLAGAAEYGELAALAAEAIDLVGAVLGKSGTGTGRMADAYERIDGNVRDGLRRIGGAGMTVTLDPELAGLLDRTGHVWPDVDEDRLAASAQSWGRLGARLDLARADHATAARSIVANNSGEAVASFGTWFAGFDEQLLRFVEVCAQVEAWLLSISRALYDTKTAIVGALDDLRQGINQAEDYLRRVPVIGDDLASGLDNTVGWLVDQARTAIGGLLAALFDPVAEKVVPALVGMVRAVKGIVQGLRKLLHGQFGADWPTDPSMTPLPQNRPRGPKALPNPKDKESTVRALRLENEAAVTLARAGYDIQQIPPRGNVATPDYLIEGKRFDCYSPTRARARNIGSEIKAKVDEDQTDRVVVNLDAPDAQSSVDDIRRQLQTYPIPGLAEAKVIGPGGAIVDVYP